MGSKLHDNSNSDIQNLTKLFNGPQIKKCNKLQKNI